MSSDILMKRASFVRKNCEIQQEFFFAHPNTKLHINQIYNCHFTGYPIWDLFGPTVERLEKTWNVSIRQTFGLPKETHTGWTKKKVGLANFITIMKLARL